MIAAPARRGRRIALPRMSKRTLGLIAIVLVVAGGGWLWFRSSSFVSIQRVEVRGLSGPDVTAIRSALVSEAERMTTLDVDTADLDAAVSRYRLVRSLRVDTRFPHAAVIDVDEQVPVATIRDGGQTVVVDADGALLSGHASAIGSLPSIPIRQLPSGRRLSSPGSRAAVRVLAAAPYPMIAHIANATMTPAHGVVVQLRRGPQIYFGSTVELARKWASAIAVLGQSSAAGANYIDVTDARRPAAGA